MEHIRREQADILGHCVSADYAWPTSMENFWSAEAPARDVSARSVAAWHADVAEPQRLTRDEAINLLALVSSSDRHTILRELLVVADHNARHRVPAPRRAGRGQGW